MRIKLLFSSEIIVFFKLTKKVFGPSHFQYIHLRAEPPLRARVTKGRPAFRNRITRGKPRVQNCVSLSRGICLVQTSKNQQKIFRLTMNRLACNVDKSGF